MAGKIEPMNRQTVPRDPIEPLLLSVYEVAELLGVSRHTVWDQVYRGELPSLHIGARRLIPRDELLATLKVRSSGGAT